MLVCVCTPYQILGDALHSLFVLSRTYFDGLVEWGDPTRMNKTFNILQTILDSCKYSNSNLESSLNQFIFSPQQSFKGLDSLSSPYINLFYKTIEIT